MNRPPQIDLQNIREYQGTRSAAFEELSVQLFRSELKGALELVRVNGAGGDGGVEAFATLQGDQEIGLQAKLFDQLGAPQWKQISASVNSAIHNHPKLTKYYVAVPLDRSPSQIEKWNKLVKQWQPSAREKSLRRKINYVWWGASELLNLLTPPSQSGKLHYWFGRHPFSIEWLAGRVDSALKDLDCRYTPDHHIQTDSERRLDAFFRKASFTNDYYGIVKAVSDAGRKLHEAAAAKETKRAAQKECKIFVSAIQKTSRGFGDGRRVPPFSDVRSSIDDLKNAVQQLNDKLEQATASPEEREKWPHRRGPFGWPLTLLVRLAAELRNLDSFLSRFACADSRKAIVIGPAGSGKSHLLANAVHQALSRQQPALLVLGEHFTGNNDPWTQLLAKLQWEGGASDFLSVLNEAADISGHPALVCIDAINESSERSLWRSHLNGFAREFERHPHVRLLIGCRSDFVQLTLPDAVAKRTDKSWATINHRGYGAGMLDAVASYFNGYNIHADHLPPLLEEFQNPLFLKTFCEAFENSPLPNGPITLKKVMDQRVSKICTKLLHDIDCPIQTTHQAIELAAELIQANHGMAVPMQTIRPKIDALFPIQGESKSLYRHLRSNGFLVEVGCYRAPTDPEAQVTVRFPYERFSDYFIAEKMIRPFKTANALKSGWTKDGTLRRIKSPPEFRKLQGIMWAMAILLPERFGIEVATLIKNRELFHQVHLDFLSSLPWRGAKSFGKESHPIMIASKRVGLDSLLSSLLRTSTIPGHPYNADYLHSRLKPMTLARRDEIWTKEISTMVSQSGDCAPGLIVKWALRVQQNLVSNNQALLWARALAWFLSSNHKPFRLRATLAAIRILEGRCEQTAQLVWDFHDCNDPFIAERVFAIACGVAMRERKAAAIRLLAGAVYETVFAGKSVPAHILLRDYARCVLELANNRNCLPTRIDPKRYRPPYTSNWPQIWTETRVKPIENAKGWEEIKSSIQPACTSMYGDFGRYVMQSHVQQFSGVRIKEKFKKKTAEIPFNAMTARRWVLQRVKQLGWTPKLFGNYERDLPCKGRQSVDVEKSRVERISKKYQWIALHQLQAYLSDHYRLTRGRGEDKAPPFDGTWNLWARDFDPSQPLRDLPDEGDSGTNDSPPTQRPWWDKYPDPLTDDQSVPDREAWVVAKPDNLTALIDIGGAPGRDADHLAVAGHYEWNENLPYYTAESENGRLKMWLHIRSWLVRRANLRPFVAAIEKLHFWGHGCMRVEVGQGWLGEYPWGQAHREIGRRCEKPDEWLQKIEIPHVQAVCEYNGGLIPSPQLCKALGARWAGDDLNFVGTDGTTIFTSPPPKYGAETPPAIVLRNTLTERLRQSGWEIVWGLLGERCCISSEAKECIVPKIAEFSGVFYRKGDSLVGGITNHKIRPIKR